VGDRRSPRGNLETTHSDKYAAREDHDRLVGTPHRRTPTPQNSETSKKDPGDCYLYHELMMHKATASMRSDSSIIISWETSTAHYNIAGADHR
jgi:hypothetical protein